MSHPSAILNLWPHDELGLSSGENMYELIHKAEKLRFLTAPQDFMGFFTGVL